MNSFREDVIDPVKKFYNDQMEKGKKLNDEMRKAEREFKEANEKHDRVNHYVMLG